MCGIIGYIGKREALPIILEGLKRMEYRGYDSAGLAVETKKGIELVKVKGKVSALASKSTNIESTGHIGIGHTRWATHGEPSERNAHPHADCGRNIFVAHNGIIENYSELKKSLQKEGHKFSSETDTEVIAHLIEREFKDDLKSAVKSALSRVKGAYSILVYSKHEPNILISAKYGSPLILGIGKNEFVLASDATAILPVTSDVLYLDDGDVVVIQRDGYKIENLSGIQRSGNKLVPTTLPWSKAEAEKGGFPHFMLKEISEQPESLRNTTRGRLNLEEGDIKFGGIEKFTDRLRAVERIVITGMGTARLSGLVGEYAFEELAGIPAKVEYSAEFAFRPSAGDAKNTALIAITQSGETADTLNAVKEAKKRGMLTIGIVNVIGSSIAREVDCGIYNHVGPEISVASTKASTSQALLLIMLAIHLGRIRGKISNPEAKAYIKEIKRLPELAEKIIANSKEVKRVAQKYKGAKNFYFLGRKYNCASAFEGALKLKEIAYVHAEGYVASELKHGPIALIDKNFPTLCIALKDSAREKNLNSIQEVKARGGKVVALATEGDKEIKKLADDVIFLPETLEFLTPVLAFVPLQLFAYYMAVARRTDVDKPRNLAKSVTVE